MEPHFGNAVKNIRKKMMWFQPSADFNPEKISEIYLNLRICIYKFIIEMAILFTNIRRYF